MKDKASGRGVVMATAVVLVTVLVLLPIFYVLSIGPVIWLRSRGWIEPFWDRGLETVYAPVEWCINHVPTVGVPIVEYAELWRADQPTSLPSLPAPPAAAPAGS